MSGLSRSLQVFISVGLAVSVRCVYAEHPVDVQRLLAEGDYFKALEVYEKLPDRRLSNDTHIAAAQSSWALGLSKQAADLFDTVLRTDGISNEDRARLTLSRGVIEYQEEHYQESALFAEKACSFLPEKAPLRGRALLLWGQSLLRAKSYVTAEEKLWRALAEVKHADRPEVAITLAQVQMKLGKLPEAERVLKVIPTEHPLAAEAVRLLTTIALQTDRNERAKFWLDKARSNYRSAFLDSWVDYADAHIALTESNISRAHNVVEKARHQLPPSDAWLIIMQASLEQAEWDEKRDRKKE